MCDANEFQKSFFNQRHLRRNEILKWRNHKSAGKRQHRIEQQNMKMSSERN